MAEIYNYEICEICGALRWKGKKCEECGEGIKEELSNGKQTISQQHSQEIKRD